MIFIVDLSNTTTSNGRMVARLLTTVSQNEIERTKIGLAGAIKVGNIPNKSPFGYKHVNKKLVVYPLTKDEVIRIFNLYYEGNSYQTISNIYNEQKVFGKTNWCDSYYENVVEPLVSKELWKRFIKFFSTDKYDDFINDLYDEDILDDNDIEIIQNNKNIDKVMIMKDKYVKIISN